MALINLRNALMTGKRLPYDAEVEYLESTGTQYILLPANNYDGVDIMLEPASGSTYGNIGRRTGTRADSICFDTTMGWAFRAYSSLTKTNDTNRSLRHATVHGTTATLDGVSYTLANGWNTVAFANKPFALFGLFNPSTQAMFAYVSCKIGACALYVGSEKVYDFISVRKGTVGYLYDRVSGKLFGNAGTGDFVLGQDVVPVEYIESHGTEYIDTGVVATNSHGFRVDIEAAQKAVDVNTRIFGAHEGNIRCGFALYGEPHSDDYFWGWNEATGFRATIPQRFVVSLNYKNDRAAIFNGTTNLSQLGTLGGMTQSVYILNANYGNAPFANQFVVGKFYGAEITVGSDVATHYIPVRVGTEGAMMDTLTRRIYRNAGTGAFTYGNDLKDPIPAE